MRILTVLMVCAVAMSYTRASAGQVRYEFTGIADAGQIEIYTFDFATQDFLPRAIFAPSASLALTGSFTLTPANLPETPLNDFYFAFYNVNNAAPSFLTSTSAAVYDSMQLGVTTDGSYFSQIQFGGFDPDYSGIFADYGGNYFGDPIIEFHDNGVMRSRTSFYQYNSLNFLTGPGVSVDGRLVLGRGREARFGIESYFVQELFTDQSQGLTNRIAFWQISGSGLLTVQGAGAVPEPATWALLVLGFGMVGGTLRTRARLQAAGGSPAVRRSSVAFLKA